MSNAPCWQLSIEQGTYFFSMTEMQAIESKIMEFHYNDRPGMPEARCHSTGEQKYAFLNLAKFLLQKYNRIPQLTLEKKWATLLAEHDQM